jgi:hypothetical protein
VTLTEGLVRNKGEISVFINRLYEHYQTQMTDYRIKLEATLDVNYARSLNIMDYFIPA